MTEENTNSQSAVDPSAVAESNTKEKVIDWEKKYNEEVKQAKSYRQRAQAAEKTLEDFNNEKANSRKKKLEEEGKLQQIIEEQDNLIKDLKDKADYGIKLEKAEKESLLSKLPEADRPDFEDLPYSQLKKIIPKVLAAQTAKPEIPSIKGGVSNTLNLDKPWGEMTETEQRAFYDMKAKERANQA